MGTKMKGLLKGLRYISQIFDPKEEEEQEMQIGLPTDVKHVAHIGFDGSSAGSSPSWMKDIKPVDEPLTASSPARQSRDSAAILSTSPSVGSSASRQQRKSNKGTAGSSGNDSPKASRKSKNKTGNAVDGVKGGGESANGNQQEVPAVPKQRRRKPKAVVSSGGSSEGSSKSKGKGDGSAKQAAIDEEEEL